MHSGLFFFYFLNKPIPRFTLSRVVKKMRTLSAGYSMPLAYYMKLACVAGVRKGGRGGETSERREETNT